MATIPVNIELDNELFEKIEKEYLDCNFTSAIRTAILYLTECIRERTDLDLDGDKLITQTFSLNNPLIKINNLNTSSEKDEQLGHMLLLQGLYKGIRNPRNHNLREDDADNFYSIISMINYCVKIIKKSKKSFDVDQFLTIVNDRFFVKTDEYSKEIVELIPEDKLLDLAIYLQKNVTDSNNENIGYFINRLILKLDDQELNQLSKHCSNILSGSNDHNKIKTIIYSFKDHWSKLEKLARIRIENMLIESLNELGIINEQDYENGTYYNYDAINEEGEFAKYLHNLPTNFSRENAGYQIFSIIQKKLLEDQLIVEFLIKNFNKYIFDDYTHIKQGYDSSFISRLNNDEDFIYEILTKTTDFHGEAEPEFQYSNDIRAAIKEYERRNNYNH